MPHERDYAEYVRRLFYRSVEIKNLVAETCSTNIVDMALTCAASLRGGGKILFCGNGGSAADAQHLAAELLVRLRPDVNRQPLAGIALTLDPSSLTACSNDYGYGSYFERATLALGRKEDVLV